MCTAIIVLVQGKNIKIEHTWSTVSHKPALACDMVSTYCQPKKEANTKFTIKNLLIHFHSMTGQTEYSEFGTLLENKNKSNNHSKLNSSIFF